MKKWVRIGFPIVCVAVVGGTLIAVGNLKKKADKIAVERNTVNSSNVTVANNKENTYEYNYSNNTVNTANKVTNTVVNTINETRTNETSTNKTSTNKTNTEEKQTSTTKNNNNTEVTTEDLSDSSEKEKAITLVAKEWGEDSSVYFTNEGISSGLYIVAVRDKSNTSVKMFYKVDLKNNTVEIDW